MHKLWTCSHKDKFLAFKSHSIVPGCIVNICLLKDYFYNINPFFKFKNLPIVFHLCGFLVYEDPVHIFYANLYLFPDDGELKTPVLGTIIIMNDLLFENSFDTEFFDHSYFMNGNWPDDFEPNYEESKKFLSDTNSALTSFGPVFLCFKFHIMAQIIATTLIHQKGSLSNITGRDIFVQYCLVKKIKIN
ncbi:hypothetical protein FXO37_24772 [Capsicum annuum]|nr:hypothetical protein FXO37_24772 [Capsicum annuum]